MTIPFTHADWAAIVPVSVVAVTALVVLLADFFVAGERGRYVPIVIALIGLGVSAACSPRSSSGIITMRSSAAS